MGLVLRDEDKRGPVEVSRFLSLGVLLWVGLYVLAYGFLIKGLTLGNLSATFRGIH